MRRFTFRLLTFFFVISFSLVFISSSSLWSFFSLSLRVSFSLISSIVFSDILLSCWLMATFSLIVLLVVSAACRSDTFLNSAATELTLANISLFNLIIHCGNQAHVTTTIPSLFPILHNLLVHLVNSFCMFLLQFVNFLFQLFNLFFYLFLVYPEALQ